MRELTFAELYMVSGSGSSSCGNCDCADKSQCEKQQNSCSWENLGKKMVEYGVGGVVTGAAGGSFTPAVGTGIGAAIGGVGGVLAGGAVHLTTCWW